MAVVKWPRVSGPEMREVGGGRFCTGRVRGRKTSPEMLEHWLELMRSEHFIESRAYRQAYHRENGRGSRSVQRHVAA